MKYEGLWRLGLCDENDICTNCNDYHEDGKLYFHITQEVNNVVIQIQEITHDQLQKDRIIYYKNRLNNMIYNDLGRIERAFLVNEMFECMPKYKPKDDNDPKDQALDL